MTPFLRQTLCLLLLAIAPLTGFWLGEGMVPLASIPGTIALLTVVFGAGLLAPSPRKREKYYVLLAATLLFVGAWATGHHLARQGLADCLAQEKTLQAALEQYRNSHGVYPQQLHQLDIQLPGGLRLHSPLLHYQSSGDDYRLSFQKDHLQFEATRHTPFIAHRRDD